MTLSPNITISYSPLDCRRVKIFRLALLRAFTSRAHTPTRPFVTDLAVSGVSSAAQGLLQPTLQKNLLRSLLLGLTALLVALLLPACLECAVRLRDRRGALGLANGPEFQVSKFFAAAFGAPEEGSFRAFTGTMYACQFIFYLIR